MGASFAEGRIFKACIIRLMVQKSGDRQLRLVVSPIIYKVLAPLQPVGWPCDF